MALMISAPVSLIEVRAAAGVRGAGLGEGEGPAIDGWRDTGEDEVVRKLYSADLGCMVNDVLAWMDEG